MGVLISLKQKSNHSVETVEIWRYSASEKLGSLERRRGYPQCTSIMNFLFAFRAEPLVTIEFSSLNVLLSAYPQTLVGSPQQRCLTTRRRLALLLPSRRAAGDSDHRPQSSKSQGRKREKELMYMMPRVYLVRFLTVLVSKFQGKQTCFWTRSGTPFQRAAKSERKLGTEDKFFVKGGKKRGAVAGRTGAVGVSARVSVDKAAAAASWWWGASSRPAWWGLLRRLRPLQPWPGEGSAAAPGRWSRPSAGCQPGLGWRRIEETGTGEWKRCTGIERKMENIRTNRAAKYKTKMCKHVRYVCRPAQCPLAAAKTIKHFRGGNDFHLRRPDATSYCGKHVLDCAEGLWALQWSRRPAETKGCRGKRSNEIM